VEVAATNPDGTNIGGTGGTASTDGATFTAESNSGTAIEGAVDDAAPHTVADGKVGILRMTGKRVLRTAPSDDATGAALFPTTAAPADQTTNPSVTEIQTFPMVWTGAKWDMQRAANVFKTAKVTTAVSATVWTPASGKTPHLLGLQVHVTEDVAQASGGVIDITFKDNASAIGVGVSVAVPQTASTSPGVGFTQDISFGNGLPLAGADHQLVVALSATLTSGAVRINTRGTEE